MRAEKKWNWQQDDWPEFRWDSGKLAELEAKFLRESGHFTGAIKHIAEDDRQRLTIEIISDEAFHTSEIEGEFLDRDSLQSSIRRQFGLATDQRKVAPAEQGVSQMMVDVYRNFEAPLTDETLFHWHQMPRNGRQNLHDARRYRMGGQEMHGNVGIYSASF